MMIKDVTIQNSDSDSDPDSDSAPSPNFDLSRFESSFTIHYSPDRARQVSNRRREMGRAEPRGTQAGGSTSTARGADDANDENRESSPRSSRPTGTLGSSDVGTSRAGASGSLPT